MAEQRKTKKTGEPAEKDAPKKKDQPKKKDEPTSKKEPAKKDSGKKDSGKAKEPTGKKDSVKAKGPAKAKETKKKEPAKKPAAKSAKAAGGERKAPEVPVVRAKARYLRSSARKSRLVADLIRGKDVGDAKAILRFSARGVSRDVEKLLDSAVANAENNHELIADDLLVKEIYVDEGPTLKRFRPRAQGRATPIHKRTSHLTIALMPKD